MMNGSLIPLRILTLVLALALLRNPRGLDIFKLKVVINGSLMTPEIPNRTLKSTWDLIESHLQNQDLIFAGLVCPWLTEKAMRKE